MSPQILPKHAAVRPWPRSALWSFDKVQKKCNIFYEIRGRHKDPSVIAGLGAPQTEGVCHVYSSITGNKTDALSSSGTSGSAKAKLYPSWPASSPWVTSVGSTRFVNQEVGGRGEFVEPLGFNC